MQSFTVLRSLAMPLRQANLDTDVIIPKQYLTSPTRVGLGRYAFAPLRYLPDGRPNPEFVMNDPQLQGAQIMVCGANFGCGSAREHAVWAIQDCGVRAIVASSFGGSFRTNCFKNGILPVELPEADVLHVLDELTIRPRATLRVDLINRCVEIGKAQFPFDIPALRRERLIGGVDDITETLRLTEEIRQFEQAQRRRHSWIWQRLIVADDGVAQPERYPLK